MRLGYRPFSIRVVDSFGTGFVWVGNKGEQLKGPQMLAPRQSGRLGPGRRQVQV
jgi:hypothetical protein